MLNANSIYYFLSCLREELSFYKERKRNNKKQVKIHFLTMFPYTILNKNTIKNCVRKQQN